MEKTLTVLEAELDPPARDAYERLALDPRFDTMAGLSSVDELLANAELFEVVDGAGRVVLRYALRVDRRANGAEGFIVGAVGALRGGDLTASLLPVVERQFSGVRSIATATRRLGLVRKLQKRGYTIEAYLLRKRLEH